MFTCIQRQFMCVDMAGYITGNVYIGMDVLLIIIDFKIINYHLEYKEN